MYDTMEGLEADLSVVKASHLSIESPTGCGH